MASDISAFAVLTAEDAESLLWTGVEDERAERAELHHVDAHRPRP